MLRPWTMTRHQMVDRKTKLKCKLHPWLLTRYKLVVRKMFLVQCVVSKKEDPFHFSLLYLSNQCFEGFIEISLSACPHFMSVQLLLIGSTYFDDFLRRLFVICTCAWGIWLYCWVTLKGYNPTFKCWNLASVTPL